jgi:hypothetical protein
MTSHDQELANGFQDADFEMADLQRVGNRAAKLKKLGICAHGSTKSIFQQGVTCQDCGAHFSSDDEWFSARNKVLGR